ncbi:MAG: CBS domain-containing protein [Pseudomonadota bacterium]
MTVGIILKNKGDAVYTVAPDQSMAAAADILATHRIGVALVCEGDEVVGVLSERDIVAAVSERRERAMAARVREFMSSPVVTCGPRDRVKDIMGIMNDRRIRHLPVVEDSTVVGMISIGDVIKHRLAETQMECAVLRDVALAAR